MQNTLADIHYYYATSGGVHQSIVFPRQHRGPRQARYNPGVHRSLANKDLAPTLRECRKGHGDLYIVVVDYIRGGDIDTVSHDSSSYSGPPQAENVLIEPNLLLECRTDVLLLPPPVTLTSEDDVLDATTALLDGLDNALGLVRRYDGIFRALENLPGQSL